MCNQHSEICPEVDLDSYLGLLKYSFVILTWCFSFGKKSQTLLSKNENIEIGCTKIGKTFPPLISGLLNN